jgi:PKD repeat protein
MKKYLFSALFSFLSYFSFGQTQHIDSVVVTPASLCAGDQISIVIYFSNYANNDSIYIYMSAAGGSSYTQSNPVIRTNISGSGNGNMTRNYTTSAALSTANYRIYVKDTISVNQIDTFSNTFLVSSTPDVTLTSATGTNYQTACINTAITSITYSIAGATGAGVTGLPAGVSGSYSAGTYTISGTPTASGTFNYTVSTTGGCSVDTAKGTLFVNPNATITLSSAPGTTSQDVCVGTVITNITYNVGNGGTGAGATGLPTGVTGSYSSGTFTISGTPTVAGTFNYTVTTTGGCSSANANGTITVDPASQGGTLTPNSTQCSPASGTLTLTGHVGLVVRWESSITNGSSWNNITNTTASHSYSGITQTTLYRVRVLSGSCSFVYSNVDTVRVRPSPSNANINATFSTICNGGTTNLSGSVSNGVSSVTVYSIGTTLGGNNVYSGTTAPSGVSVSPPTTTKYYLSVSTAPCANPSVDSITITVLPNSTGSLSTSSNLLCQGSSATLTPTVSGATNGITTYQIIATGAGAGVIYALSTVPPGPQNVTPPTGSTDYTYTITTLPCPPVNYAVNIKVNPTPVGNLTVNNATVCEGASVNLNPTITNGIATVTTYTIVATGAGAGVIHPLSTTPPVITPVTPPVGVTTYTYTITTAPCLAVSYNVIVTVNPKPVADFSVPNQCFGFPSVFTDLSTVTSGNIVKWSWNFGNPSSGNKDTSTAQNPLHLYTTQGTFNVTLTVTTDKNCTHTFVRQAIVSPLPVPVITGPTTVCNGSNVMYSTTSNFAFISWFVEGGKVVSGQGNDSAIIGWDTSATTVNMKLIVSSGNCSDSTTISITINPKPSKPTLLSTNPSSVCFKQKGVNFGVAPQAGVEYFWSCVDTAVAIHGARRPGCLIDFPSAGGPFNIYVTVINANGCRDSSLISLAPTSSTPSNPTIIITNSNKTFVCLDNNQLSYQWGYEDTALVSHDASGATLQDYTPAGGIDLNSRNYYVKLNAGGCTYKVYYNAPLGIEPVAPRLNLSLQPNPNRGDFILVYDGLFLPGDVFITDVLGKKITDLDIHGGPNPIHIPGLSSGVYYIHARDVRGNHQSLKFVLTY